MDVLCVKPYAASPPDDVPSIHASHADFVWRSLQRLGVRDADLEDMLQEVFVVVHRRLHTHMHQGALTTWLFGICLRVAANYRRKAWVRRERSAPASIEVAAPDPPPDESLADREARDLLAAILDRLTLEQRAVFVMFELEELSCDDIASTLGIPVGTVYSRLYAARKQVAKGIGRIGSKGTGR